MDLILFSTEHSDLKMVEAATWLAEDNINLYAFFDNAAWTGPGGALFGYRDMMILEASVLSDWGPALSSILLQDLDPSCDKLFMDAGFFVRHIDWLPQWLEEARNYDFFSALGKFIQAEDGRHRFGFPSWECAFISTALWRSEDLHVFLRKMPLKMTRDEKYFHERYFFEHFSKQFRVGCAMDHIQSGQFDPATQHGFSLPDIWKTRAGIAAATEGGGSNRILSRAMS